MDRRHLVAGLLTVVVVVVASVAFISVWSVPSGPLDADQAYPPGAGPDQINFSDLDAGDANLTHTPRTHWESYAIRYSAPPERRLVEGEYYINSPTGEILADRWHDAEVYRNGTEYAFFQPAESLPEHQREQFASDPQFAYDDATDAYYRYDPHYGQIAPTNIGRHTMLLDSYHWEAVNRTTHHGVPIITYRATGTRSDSGAPPLINGTLRLGVEDGLLYGYDITRDADERPYRYTYSVEPAPFPEHEWVDTARDLAANATNSNSK
jgi:hypothetical protein